MNNLNNDFFGEFIDENKDLFANIKSWVWALGNSNENETRDIITALNNERSKGVNSRQVISLMFALKSMNIEY